MTVLDAYAVIAYLRGEPCADEVSGLLRAAILTSIDAAEVRDAEAYCDRLLTVRQCADMFGVSRTIIVKFLVDQGIALRRAGAGLDEEAMVSAYRDQGLSLQECGARFGISPRRVTAVLDRHGVSRRPAGRPARPRN